VVERDSRFAGKGNVKVGLAVRPTTGRSTNAVVQGPGVWSVLFIFLFFFGVNRDRGFVNFNTTGSPQPPVPLHINASELVRKGYGTPQDLVGEHQRISVQGGEGTPTASSHRGNPHASTARVRY
jgi:hypothetical protein